MSRQDRFSWFRSCQPRQRSTNRACVRSFARRLHVEVLEDRRMLAVVSVDTLFDEDDGPGVGVGTSLRDAIAISSPGDTINFDNVPEFQLPAPSNGVIQLSLGELVVGHDLTINGPTHVQLNIEAFGNDPTPGDPNQTGDGSRIFAIGELGGTPTVTIRDVGLRGGDPLDDGGIATDHGGAIYSEGNLTLKDVVLFQNHADGKGGAVFSTGSLTILGGAAQLNTSDDDGGGIYSDGSLTLDGVTVSGNSTTDGETGTIFSTDGENTGHGGAIWSLGTTHIIDSTISGNQTGDGGDGYDRNYFPTDYSYGGNAGDGGAIWLSGIATISNSIISGNHSGRGGDAVSNYLPPGTNGDPYGRIAGKPGYAGDGGGIYTSGNLTITGTSQISGNHTRRSGTSSYYSTFKGGKGGGIASGNSPITLAIRDTTIADNIAGEVPGEQAKGLGGGLYVVGAVNLERVTLDDNEAESGGGALIRSGAQTATISDSTLFDNVAINNGGGVLATGNLSILRTSVVQNESLNEGGGIHATPAVGESFLLQQSTVSGNKTLNAGAGIFVGAASTASGSATLKNSTITDNIAGFYFYSPELSFGKGGGVASETESLELDHSIVARNTAYNSAPDLHNMAGSVSANHSLIEDNAGSGLSPSPFNAPGPSGNLISGGPTVAGFAVELDVAAMGDFEASDVFAFEYSADGGAFQPLFTSTVDEAGNQNYVLGNGAVESLNDPLLLNGIALNNEFQTIAAIVPDAASSLQIRFSATANGGSEAFAFRNLVVRPSIGSPIVMESTLGDLPTTTIAFSKDADYDIPGDMFGFRSHLAPGLNGLPFAVADDTLDDPFDEQGLVGWNDFSSFFGVVDTVNGVGNDTNTATWTFDLTVIKPFLGLLDIHGGNGRTVPLQPGSPAIDTGSAVAPLPGPTDQRGAPFSREVDGDGDGIPRIDLGAHEWQSFMTTDHTFTVDTASDVDDSDYSPGNLSLREALRLSDFSDGIDTIRFDASLTGETITLENGPLFASSPVRIIGLGAENLTIDASGNDPTPEVDNGDGSGVFVFQISRSLGNLPVEMRNLGITGGDNAGKGGGISSSSSLLLDGVRIYDNNSGDGNGGSGGSGGGVYSREDIVLLNSVITGNISRDVFGEGGGIDAAGNILVRNSEVTQNQTLGLNSSGGGINAAGNLTLHSSVIDGNSTAGPSSPAAYTSSGGGVNATDLRVVNSTIRGNTTAGNFADGGGASAYRAVIEHSTISGNSTLGDNAFGGGASIQSNAWISDSVVRANDTSGINAAGGGIDAGEVNILRTVIASNSTLGNGAAGGGVFAEEIILDASEVSANRAAGLPSDVGQAHGAGLASLGDIYITNSTLSFNTVSQDIPFSDDGGSGAAAFANGKIVVRNSTLADNQDLRSPWSTLLAVDGNVELYSSVWVNNIGGMESGNGIVYAEYSSFPGFGVTGLIIGPGVLFDTDPALGPLSNNGGATLTHAPNPGSPILDAANPSPTGVPSYDQRGAPFLRQVDSSSDGPGRMDMGSFESQTITSLPVALIVDNEVDEHDGDFTAGNLSLREALTLANAVPGHDTITFSPLLAGETISLRFSELPITENVSIEGLGADQLTIDASANDLTPNQNDGQGSRIFRVLDTALNVTISGLTLTGGDAGNYGGAIYATGPVTSILRLEGLLAYDNFAPLAGGAFAKSDGSLRVSETTVTGNSTDGSGGGISNASGLIVDNSTISGNRAGTTGGGIDGAGSTINNSTITLNESVGLGGGIQSPNTITLNNTIVADNTDTSGQGQDVGGTVNANYTLISDTQGASVNGANNLLDVPARLAPLSDNGGPTPTHALYYSSPAINAGDPTITSDPTEFDQRGDSFLRVVDGRVDIGAVENAIARPLTNAVAETLGLDSSEVEDLDAGLLIWLDGSDAATYVIDQVAAEWRDKSGNDLFAVQIDATRAPQQSGVWLDFSPDSDGFGPDNDDALDIILGSPPPGPWTGTVAYEVDGNSSDQGIVNPAPFTAAGFSVTHHFNQVFSYYGNGSNYLTTTADVGLPHAAISAWAGGTNPSDRLLWNNGEQVLTGAGGPVAANDLSSLLVLGDAATPLDGRIGTVMIHSGVLSETARQQLEGYLAAIWGTSLPAGHPYATAPTADFDQDTDVDGADFLAWQRGFGATSGATLSEGDSNGDGAVDAADLSNWQDQYGTIAAPLASASQSPSSEQSALSSDAMEIVAETASSLTASPTELIDAAMAADWRTATIEEEAGMVEDLVILEIPLASKQLVHELAVAQVEGDPSEVKKIDSDDQPATNEPWLADVLLERVFV